ncbi:MAG: tRNA pseudouridine(38-40) synthase TruA [Pedosphaera sp.]|nr:tRNA pseudouridine(38-40) synthase TruA [Pedosphaera sp.]
MLRFKLTIAYDGTRYFGWQVQKGRMTVQQRVEEALRELFPSVKRVHSSSRTDTGVHALGMVAHVDIPEAECRMDARKLLLAVNSFLPVDVRIVAARRVPEDFHARFDAKGKRYFYLIWNHAAMNPLLHNRAWHVKVPLNLERMQKAAKLFVGRKDFKSFASTREYEMESTVRRLTRCDVRKEGYTWKITIEGDGFLYKMCRGIVGTLVRVGQGDLTQTEIRQIFRERDRSVAGMNAPACGLTLWRVFY